MLLAGGNWRDHEVELLLDNRGMDAAELAELLPGRSAKAVYQKQWVMRKQADSADFDTRPTGSYTEIIGTLLLDYEDAFEAWKHYHRYVKTEILYHDSLGWTTLLCWRDSDAEW